MRKIQRILKPEIFQGARRAAPYFEGWYYKIQLPDGRLFAFIPGISRSKGDSHCFMQVIGADADAADLLSFPMAAFRASADRFAVAVGNNTFTQDEIAVDTGKIRAAVRFVNAVPYASGEYSAGIMGPFTFVPFLECRHAVLTVTSGVEGRMETKSGRIDLSGGSGYIEKDWGRAFPKAYVWMQTGRFAHSKASFMLSVARVPVLGRTFWGFIGFLYENGRFFRFSTYDGSRIQSFACGKNLQIELYAHRHIVRVTAFPQTGILLKAPAKSGMDREVRECTHAKLAVALYTREGETVFSDTADFASLEIVGPWDAARRNAQR